MRTLTILFALSISIGVAAQDFPIDSWGLNSAADEQTPLLVNGGKTIFFTRSHHPENTGGKADRGDIWMSEFVGGGWSSPEKLPSPINSAYYSGAFHYAANLLYVYGNDRKEMAPKPGVSVASLIKWPGEWTAPKALEIKYFQNKSANNGNALSDDGKILILSMESFKTIGAEDLYVSFWQESENAWSEPKNMGANINTPLQELTPFLAADNKTLFFSTNGRGGRGSRDIFVSQRLDESWSNWSIPKNLGASVNTEGAEMGYRYYPELELAVYTSTKNSDGYGDIQFIQVIAEDLNILLEEEIVVPTEVEPAVEEEEIAGENMFNIKGKILDSSTGELVFARTKVKGADAFEQEHYNDTTYSFILASKQDYILQVEAEGYLSKQIDLFTMNNDNKEIKQDVKLDPIVVGARVKLDNVLFIRGKTEFLKSSYNELNLVVEMLLNNPTMKIELAGHTDNVGSGNLNIRLSQERVDVVINYLAEEGIDISRLSGTGYGGAKPIASNATESTRRLNRRVEFIVVSQ